MYVIRTPEELAKHLENELEAAKRRAASARNRTDKMFYNGEQTGLITALEMARALERRSHEEEQ